MDRRSKSFLDEREMYSRASGTDVLAPNHACLICGQFHPLGKFGNFIRADFEKTDLDNQPR